MRLLLRPAALSLLLLTAWGCPDGRSDDDDNDATVMDDDDDAGTDDDDSAVVGDDDDAVRQAASVNCAAAEPSISSLWGTPSTVAFSAVGRWNDGATDDGATRHDTGRHHSSARAAEPHAPTTAASAQTADHVSGSGQP